MMANGARGVTAAVVVAIPVFALSKPASNLAPKAHTAACELGVTILAEPKRHAAIYDDEYDDRSGRLRPPEGMPAHNLFTACPELRNRLPPGARLATEDDLKRASEFPPVNPATVSWISAPLFNRSFTRATVWDGYNCPGLCAGQYEYVYEKKNGAWIRRGAPEMSVNS